MGQESDYYRPLSSGAHFRVEGTRLSISNAADETVLVFLSK